MKKITLLFTLLAVTFGFAQNGGDDCDNAVVITPGSFSDTTINDLTPGTNDGDSAWFSFTPGADGIMDISSCADPDDIDTRLFVFTGNCGALVQYATDDDSCPFSFKSLLEGVPVTGGTEYFIQWDDRWDIDPFDWILTFRDCVPAIATATVVDDCGNSQYTIDVDVTDMGDSAFLTISNDYDANTVNVPGIGMYSIGPFPAGTEVIATLAHEDNTNCDLTGLFIDTCPPANDDCAQAINVECDDTVNGYTIAATDSGGNSNPASDVWYSYTGAGVPEDVTLTLCNSGYDTAIRVYTDCSVTLGAQVLFNDDSCGTRSEGTFASDGTTTYYIMIEGWNDSNGFYEMTVSCAAYVPPPPNDLCVNAEALTLDTLTPGTTAGATDDSIGGVDDTTCEPFTFKSDVWYTFVASDTDVSIQTTISGNSDQANVAVYSSIDCSQLDADSIACSDGNGGESFDLGGLTPAATYYIRVWSDGVALEAPQRSEGTFNITVNDALLSTSSFNINGFEYFPNPVNDKLSVRAQSNIQNVSVFNIVGQEVMRIAPNAVSTDVDMSALSQGPYFVNVTINDTTETIKIIKR